MVEGRNLSDVRPENSLPLWSCPSVKIREEVTWKTKGSGNEGSSASSVGRWRNSRGALLRMKTTLSYTWRSERRFALPSYFLLRFSSSFFYSFISSPILLRFSFVFSILMQYLVTNNNHYIISIIQSDNILAFLFIFHVDILKCFSIVILDSFLNW